MAAVTSVGRMTQAGVRVCDITAPAREAMIIGDDMVLDMAAYEWRKRKYDHDHIWAMCPRNVAVGELITMPLVARSADSD